MCGDVEFNETALRKVNKITPVPGGVGPLTIAMLMSNLVKSWDLQHENKLVGT
jgi:methylenetetrahydrofolate dehydrogenase (NADP+)/methenyltetrahydrofolate cyclohydrolase